ncbi:MAG: SGNH/GDSL hydrolase family protein [Planctomycetota bacterium]
MLHPATAAGDIFTDLIVFGDSLSDSGNTQYTTSTGFLGLFAPDTPGDAYFEGRFSNGLVWTDWASRVLTPSDPISPQRTGGDNFAFGGARTEGTDFLTDIYIDDLVTQIDTFQADRTGDPDALYTLLIGANDFFNDNASGTPVAQLDFNTPAQRVGAALQDLYNEGARNFLLLNLPWIGLTPSYNGNATEAAAWNTLSQDYNAQLASQADQFRLANADAVLFELDTAGLLNNTIANATELGFTNLTDSAAPGLEPGDNGYDPSQIVPNPDEYVFYDGVHPTARVHKLLGFAAVRAVVPTGDFNVDGEVTIADYEFWRDNFGSTELLEADANGNGVVDTGDYTIWRDAFAAAAPASAPEPTAAGLLAAVSFILASGRRRSTSTD